MSKVRSPCTVCSTTIGICGLIAAPSWRGCTRSCASSGLDRLAPERDAAEHEAEGLPRRRPRAVEEGRGRGGRLAGVDPAAAVRLRRAVPSRQLQLQPVLAAAAARDQLLPRRPERVVDDRAEPKGAPGFDDEPAAPAEDRRGVVGRCHESGALTPVPAPARAEARPALPARATPPAPRAAPDPRAARPCA